MAITAGDLTEPCRVRIASVWHANSPPPSGSIRKMRRLARAKKDGLAASDLIRKGLRVVAARYYRHRRSPSTGLFVSTDAKLGDESEIFRDLER